MPHPQDKKQWDWKRRIRAELDVCRESRVYRFSFRPRGKLDLTWRNKQIEKIAYKDLRAWYLRLRKKHIFKYVAVAEFGGKGGRIHWHVIVHGPVPSRDVRKAWKQGQTHVKNISQGKMAQYVTKYIGKDMSDETGKSLRVRASQRYGVSAYRELCGHLARDPVVRSVVVQFGVRCQSPRVPAGPYLRKLVPDDTWNETVDSIQTARCLDPLDRREASLGCGGFTRVPAPFLDNARRDAQLRARALSGNYWTAEDELLYTRKYE